jgi:elongation factor 2
VAVQPSNPVDLPKFIEGLKRLCKSDQLVQCETDKGQYVIAGAGELHLETCLRDLEKVYARVPIKKSQPIVKYKETVDRLSDQECLAKTANKLNRMTAQPLSTEFCQDIENNKISLNQDVKDRAKYLQSNHGFDLNEAKKIW